ncbi:hypothetical protein LAZ67_22000007 [Cordylochernes scorpioides]|uniref:Uncharacterized protein n=1 Tax=Cordylochernes scorpioides TaxID=51811 RepID=A0ABY6LNY4_9ARAC|nr:hypothetical protein LAZ67_22000007 [Cordylochernes scorpioides]
MIWGVSQLRVLAGGKGLGRARGAVSGGARGVLGLVDRPLQSFRSVGHRRGGTTKPATQRNASRGGARRISNPIREETRGAPKAPLESVKRADAVRT